MTRKMTAVLSARLWAGMFLCLFVMFSPLPEKMGKMQAEAASCLYDNGSGYCSPVNSYRYVPGRAPVSLSGIEVLVSGNTLLTVNVNRYGTARVTRVETYKNAVRIPVYVAVNGFLYTVTEIGAYAFSASPYLSQVSLPPSISVIMSGAFSNAPAISKVTITTSGALLIKPGAFRRADRLRVIQFLSIPGTLRLSTQTFLGFDSQNAAIKFPVSITDAALSYMEKRMVHAGFQGKVVRRIH